MVGHSAMVKADIKPQQREYDVDLEKEKIDKKIGGRVRENAWRGTGKITHNLMENTLSGKRKRPSFPRK